MKRVLITAMLAGLVCVGCNKPAKGPKIMNPELGAPGTGPVVEPGGPLAGDPMPLPPVTGPTPLIRPEMGPVVDVAPIEPAAPEAPVAPAGGGTHVIKKGDTFIKIAREVYGDPSKMKDIAAANPGVNPRKLKIGQIIILPAVEARK